MARYEASADRRSLTSSDSPARRVGAIAIAQELGMKPLLERVLAQREMLTGYAVVADHRNIYGNGGRRYHRGRRPADGVVGCAGAGVR